MCIDIIPTKWERTRLEIISKLSLLSFLTSSSFPSSVLGKGRSWEQTVQGEEFIGGTKWTRLETAWSTRQYLLTGTTTVTGRQKQYHTPAKPSVYSNISRTKKAASTTDSLLTIKAMNVTFNVLSIPQHRRAILYLNSSIHKKRINRASW